MTVDTTDFPSGCNPSLGCIYTVKECAAPTDACTELVMDGSATGCCTYVAKDCAGRFGNDPGYTYSREVVDGAGVCPSHTDGNGRRIGRDGSRGDAGSGHCASADAISGLRDDVRTLRGTRA